MEGAHDVAFDRQPTALEVAGKGDAETTVPGAEAVPLENDGADDRPSEVVEQIGQPFAAGGDHASLGLEAFH